MKSKHIKYRPKYKSRAGKKRSDWISFEDSKSEFEKITLYDLESRKRTPEKHASKHPGEFRSVLLP